jgi:SSS family solute:Na+ symporter
MVLIFVLAIVPGWITEQDPWQRVWAAKDTAAARKGMFFGSFLVALVFGGCALIALGLGRIYPEIAKAGFPMGMAQAEPALLTFIMESKFSAFSLALCAVALATAAMSCTDTFAASGASCISRDIFQRYIHTKATVKQIRVVNRVSVLIIILLATVGSLFINSIIDAIHIATFIASASYFFVLMGGLYWKRATGPGAIASLWTGFFVQSGLVILDLAKTPPMAPSYLEGIHPALMGHGVIPAMMISGAVFVLVSLVTRPSAQEQLDLFFDRKTWVVSSDAELAGVL